MKNEHCNFDSCRFSKVCNHIHCIRAGCSYVLHSSGQLYSHKRKHERRDSELAYRQYRLAQSVYRAINPLNDSAMSDSAPFAADGSSVSGDNFPPMGFGLPFNASMSLPLSIGSDHHALASEMQQQHALMNLSVSDLPRAMAMNDPAFAALYSRMPSMMSQLEAAHSATSSATSTGDQAGGQSDAPASPSPVMSEEDAFKLCMAKVDGGKPCFPGCEISSSEHYHCRSDGCSLAFK